MVLLANTEAASKVVEKYYGRNGGGAERTLRGGYSNRDITVMAQSRVHALSGLLAGAWNAWSHLVKYRSYGMVEHTGTFRQLPAEAWTSAALCSRCPH